MKSPSDREGMEPKGTYWTSTSTMPPFLINHFKTIIIQ